MIRSFFRPTFHAKRVLLNKSVRNFRQGRNQPQLSEEDEFKEILTKNDELSLIKQKKEKYDQTNPQHFVKRMLVENLNVDPNFEWDNANTSTIPTPTADPINAFQTALYNKDYQESSNKFHLLSKDPSFSPSPAQINAFLDIIIHLDVVDNQVISQVMEVIERTKMQLDIDFSTKIMQIYAKSNSDISLAKTHIDEMKVRGISPTLEIYNSLITILVKFGKLESVVDMLQTMRDSDLIPNHTTYENLINGYIKQDKLTEAERVFTSLKEEGIVKTVIMYESFISYYIAQKDIEKSFVLFEDALAANTVSSDLVKTIIALSIETKNIDKAAVFLDALVEQNISVLDASVFGKIACYYADAMNPEESLITLEKMMIKLKVLPELETYSYLIISFCKQGLLAKANDLVAHMTKHFIQPTSIIHETIIETTIKGDTDAALLLLQEADEKGYATTRMFNAVLLGLAADHDYQTAIRIWNDWEYNQMEKDTVSYNTMLRIFVSINTMKESMNVFHQMINLKMKIEPGVVFELFEMAVRGRKYKDATQLLIKIREKDEKQNISTLIKTFASEWEELLKGMLQSTDIKMKKMSDSGLQGDMKDIKSQKEMGYFVYKELLRNNIKLSPKTIAIIIGSYHQDGDLVNAVRAWTIMRNQHVEADANVVESLLYVCRDLGHEKTGNVIIQMKEREKWILSNQSYDHLIHIMSKVGNAKELIKLILDLRDSKYSFTLAHYSAIVSTLQQYKHKVALEDLRKFVEENMPTIIEAYDDKVETMRMSSTKTVFKRNYE